MGKGGDDSQQWFRTRNLRRPYLLPKTTGEVVLVVNGAEKSARSNSAQNQKTREKTEVRTSHTGYKKVEGGNVKYKTDANYYNSRFS